VARTSPILRTSIARPTANDAGAMVTVSAAVVANPSTVSALTVPMRSESRRRSRGW
jgi:hypothetical protein